MPAFTAGLVARFPRADAFAFRLFHWRNQRLADNWTALVAQTPDAPRFANYPAESNPFWFMRTTANNCYTYANATRATIRSERKQPGATGQESPVLPQTCALLVAALEADGWIPGAPSGSSSDVHVAVAFVGRPRAKDGSRSDKPDFHFYRLGPDGWSHKPGDEKSEQVGNPFVDAAKSGYTQFAGWWLVPHDEALNRVRFEHRAQEHPLLEIFDLRGPLD